jgi:CelD/BcsL family acetyltransferase involved in cellulose biosynthesis
MLATLPATATVRDAQTEPRSLSTEVITSYEDFVGLETAWNDAVERAHAPHPFVRHEWIRTWWECFGAGRQLHIVVVRRGGRIAAIAPLMRESSRMYGLPVRQLRMLHNDHTPRTDIIVADEPADSYRAIWNALLDCQHSWDLVLLNQIPAQSPTRDTLFAHATEKNCPTGVWPSSQSPYLELHGSWDTYYASLSSKFKQNLRNRLSRLNQLGEAVLEAIEDAAEIRDCYQDAWRLEASGWKREEGTAITSDPAVNRFYTLLADRATRHGWLRLLFLTVNGRRIATSYGSNYGGRLFLFKTGYDPEFAKCSPFKLLTFFATQKAFKEGLSEVDFLGDAEPWKLEWTSSTRDHEWLFIFSHTRLGRLLHRAKFQVVPAVKRWRG